MGNGGSQVAGWFSMGEWVYLAQSRTVSSNKRLFGRAV